MSHRQLILDVLKSDGGKLTAVAIKKRLEGDGLTIPTSTVRGRLWDLKRDGIVERIPRADDWHPFWKVKENGNGQRVTIQ